MTGDGGAAQLVICGLGGQGAIFLTRVLAEAAILEGREVLTAETHGMAQRGGAVESHIKLGDFEGSIVRKGRADAVLALDASRLEAARGFLAPGGVCFVNGPEGTVGARACDAARIAGELSYARGANLVLLGFAAAAAPGLFPAVEALLGALDRLSPPAACDSNRRALERGTEIVEA